MADRAELTLATPTHRITRYDVALLGPNAAMHEQEVQDELSEQVTALGLSMGREVVLHIGVPPDNPRLISRTLG